nr:hypothetical protein [Marinobacter sp. es.048]
MFRADDLIACDTPTCQWLARMGAHIEHGKQFTRFGMTHQDARHTH